MKIAILGYGAQGRSAYAYWRGSNEITICDSNANLKVPDDVHKHLGTDYLKGLQEFDLLVRTPVLHPREIVKANPEAPNILGRVTTVTNEFMRVSPTKHIIGVTGTKGKGTTCTLIARMLETAGKRVHLGGNIGIPPLDLLKNDIRPSDWVVLELANFQLIDLKQSPPIAICVMVNEEHLDWHTDFAEYLRAKQQLFVHQTAQDIAIYYAKNEFSKQIAAVSPGNLTPYMRHPGAVVETGNISYGGQTICSVGELKLLGKHNWQNICAAVTAVWPVVQNTEPLRETLINFSGLPHRLELIRELNGVTYYNDSFASGPGATIAAIETIPKPKVMIIGGYDRGLKLEELAKSVRQHLTSIKQVLIIGASADRTAKAFLAEDFKKFEVLPFKTMTEIVTYAHQTAQPGDAVVLSPGFASFDMFKNFEERGLQFTAAVKAL